MTTKFDYNHIRAKEARLGQVFNQKLIKAILVLSIIAGFIFGGLILYQGNPLAWLFFAVAILVLMFTIWIQTEIKELPTRDGTDINNIISRELLANLGKKPSQVELAQAAEKTASGRFLANRYGMIPQYVDTIALGVTCTIDEIFEKAYEIREKTNSEHISGATVIAAILECNPRHEDTLKAFKLEMEDIYGGIVWYNYLHGVVKGLKAPRRTGGLGRDLDFGYTPLLQKFAQNVSRTIEGAHIMINQASSQEVIDEMIKVFSHGGRQNVALIGEEGSGRKTIVHAFASELLNADSKISSKLKFRQVFKLDASAMVSVANERGELERLMMQIFGEAYSAKNIILWLDNAQLFFEEGVGSVDISKVILPVIQAGKLRIILTMEQQRFLEIESRNSQLANALNKIMVPPSTPEETMKILQDRVPYYEYEHNVVYTIWALKEAYRLSEKYIHDMVMPGRALNLLEASAGFATERLVTAESVQMSIEKTYGIKMQASQNDDERQRLLNMESLIHERMIDQKQAVRAVSDALRRSAAGVRNEKRPIGTFLFLGPTGVGKTELAKAISDVYFHGEGAIVRIDLNEFVAAESVDRLIEDGAVNENSLTSQVMKRPFSVVLLDEIEKAHPKVLTTLLQLLDEGVLRDIKNREVSFRDTIVVATSNAGADKIRQYIDEGHDLSAVKEELTNELIANGEFKPEFLNRFDEICIFKPLSKEDLGKIFDLTLKGVNKTLESQKITVEVDDDAKAVLVEKGYDPKLGARPMKRVVQSYVENITAKAMLAGNLAAGGNLRIDKEMLDLEDDDDID